MRFTLKLILTIKNLSTFSSFNLQFTHLQTSNYDDPESYNPFATGSANTAY